MRRDEEGARVRFKDNFMEVIGATPLPGFGYSWGSVVSSDGKSAQVKWDLDGQTTTVSDIRNLTTRQAGKYAT